ncbi:leucyl aminopeptidase [Inhella gelatinilytica]|uniref:Probable cytosol aminopeptidase n=1 Tax=Inhella gelatinilytica TaxID=2795030 RepID=A0A931NEJ1_9BURK|nr:leucyl aminopeptidase [Inhella gelatinilytica]MBH9553744.1 leucyl aminopeptidase [Inhella gelatinilytica]
MDARIQSVSIDKWASATADALLVVLGGDGVPASMDAALANAVKSAVKLGDFDWKTGKALMIVGAAGVKAPRLILAAAGKPSAKSARAAVVAGLAQLKGRNVAHVAIAFAGFGALSEQIVEQGVLATRDSAYLYQHTKPSAPKDPRVSRVTVLVDKADLKAAKAGLALGQAVGEGVELARELANRPGNYCTPTHLADCARDLGRKHGLKVEVLDKKAVERLGMGSFLAVAQGGDEPLRFIVARYDGAPRTQAPVVLVGKGITFDTGGISLKPGAEMDEMKFDMGGAASVLGALRAVVELKPKLNLVVLIPACENMPSGKAVKPGDVVTSMSGQTIEILNTDAEGRLILCDALTYAERFKPRMVVDVATLTGACVIALGGVRSGMYASDDELAQALSTAGETALDPCWRMPLDDEYDEGLKSNFADVANVGSRAGGSITAAMFLKRFAKAYRWGHLDIAGTAWKGGAAKGATGRPVGLLTHFLLSQVV